jgi:hypothetical protein
LKIAQLSSKNLKTKKETSYFKNIKLPELLDSNIVESQDSLFITNFFNQL